MPFGVLSLVGETHIKEKSILQGGWFSINMSSYQYNNSNCGDKMILWKSYLHYVVSHAGKTASLYWIRAQVMPLQIHWQFLCSVIRRWIPHTVIWKGRWLDFIIRFTCLLYRYSGSHAVWEMLGAKRYVLVRTNLRFQVFSKVTILSNWLSLI